MKRKYEIINQSNTAIENLNYDILRLIYFIYFIRDDMQSSLSLSLVCKQFNSYLDLLIKQYLIECRAQLIDYFQNKQKTLPFFFDSFLSLIKNVQYPEETYQPIKQNFLNILEYAHLHPTQANMCFLILKLNLKPSDLIYKMGKIKKSVISVISEEDIPKIIYKAFTTDTMDATSLSLFQQATSYAAKTNTSFTMLSEIYNNAKINQNGKFTINFFNNLKRGSKFFNLPDLLIFNHLSNRIFRYGNFNGLVIQQPIKNIDFTGAYLNKATFLDNLEQITLDKASLIEANFKNNTCIDVSFIGSILLQANMSHSKFENSNITDADLRGSFWGGTTLLQCQFRNNKINRANNFIITINLDNIDKDFTNPYGFIQFNKKRILGLNTEEINHELLFALHCTQNIKFFSKNSSRLLNQLINFIYINLDKSFEENVTTWINSNASKLESDIFLENFLHYLNEHLEKYLDGFKPLTSGFNYLESVAQRFDRKNLEKVVGDTYSAYNSKLANILNPNVPLNKGYLIYGSFAGLIENYLNNYTFPENNYPKWFLHVIQLKKYIKAIKKIIKQLDKTPFQGLPLNQREDMVTHALSSQFPEEYSDFLKIYNDIKMKKQSEVGEQLQLQSQQLNQLMQQSTSMQPLPQILNDPEELNSNPGPEYDLSVLGFFGSNTNHSNYNLNSEKKDFQEVLPRFPIAQDQGSKDLDISSDMDYLDFSRSNNDGMEQNSNDSGLMEFEENDMSIVIGKLFGMV